MHPFLASSPFLEDSGLLNMETWKLSLSAKCLNPLNYLFYSTLLSPKNTLDKSPLLSHKFIEQQHLNI
jgi:hypothetical protein